MTTTLFPSFAPSAPLELHGYELRPYQTESINALREGLRAGHKRQILCAPTGSGKTVIAAHLIHEARKKGSECAFVVDRIALVDQASQRFSEFGIPHGVMQGKRTYGRVMPVKVCSAQTIERRGFWPSMDFVIVDEAHSMRKATIDFIKSIDKPVVGLTATPFTEGLGSIYSNVVNTCTTDYLLNALDPDTGRTYLAPLKVYAAREIDMEGAKTNRAGEWRDREVEERGATIIGDAVKEWHDKTIENFGRPVKTLIRSATIAHGQAICRAFQAAGFDFRQVTAYTNEEDAQRLIEDFRQGAFLGLVSVAKLEKGFDVADIMCLVDQRPLRKSLAAEIQFLGRGMRPYAGKDSCLVLDHTGNYLGFMEEIHEFFEHGVNSLDDGRRKNVVRKERKERPDAACECGYVLPPGMVSCPACGQERSRTRTGIHVAPGRMEEVVVPGSRKWKQNKRWVWRQICRVALNGKRDMEAANRFAWKQYQVMMNEPPPDRWDFDPVEGEADRRVTSKVQSQLIAWVKGRKQRGAR